MRRPVVDLRKFRFRKLNDPEFRHLKWLGGWLFYFSMYFITENLIPTEACHPMHMALDDLIPFCEYFVIPYVFWYVLCFGSLLYYGIYDPKRFTDLQKFIIITQVIAMTTYILYPSRQDLRPETFEHHNLCTLILTGLYAFDTSTGVCPSLHVAYSLGIASVFLKDKEAPRWWKVLLVFLVILISLATTFVKQHSMVDVLAAIPVGIVAEILVYGKSYWLPKLTGKTDRSDFDARTADGRK